MTICCKDFEPYNQAWSDQLLMNVPPNLVFSIFASYDLMPTNEGCDLKYARKIPLKPVTTEIDMDCCGPDGDPCCLQYEFSIVKPKFYGCYAPISKLCTLQSILPRVQSYVDEFADQYRLSEDAVIGQIFRQNASVYYARCGNNGDFPTNQSGRDYLMAWTKIRKKRARFLTKALYGNNIVDSRAVPAAFAALLHPDLVPDLYDLEPTFVPVSRYSRPDMALLSEEGYISKVRILVGDQEVMDDILVTKEASDNGNDVYDIPIIGQNAYVAMRQKKFSPKIQFRDKPGPYDKCMYVSWMASFGTGIINPDHMINMKVTMGGTTC